MARSRRIWPISFRSVAAMVQHGVIVRVGCARCETFFDVDLRAIALKRGPEFSLIDKEVQCKVTRCRGQSFFLAARSFDAPMITLLNADVDPLGVERKGIRPIDLEPPDPPYGDAAAARAKSA